jgi:hypothetical protein
VTFWCQKWLVGHCIGSQIFILSAYKDGKDVGKDVFLSSKNERQPRNADQDGSKDGRKSKGNERRNKRNRAKAEAYYERIMAKWTPS